MLVFIPNKKDPLYGAWCDVDSVPKVNPSAVRAIYRERRKNKIVDGGIDPTKASAYAVSDVASMLGLTEKTVRTFCRIERSKVHD
jgi:hypothetical protein